MNSETIEGHRAIDAWNKEQRRLHGVACPGCKKRFPKANPKILMPGQKCFCGYQDPRKENNE